MLDARLTRVCDLFPDKTSQFRLLSVIFFCRFTRGTHATNFRSCRVLRISALHWLLISPDFELIPFSEINKSETSVSLITALPPFALLAYCYSSQGCASLTASIPAQRHVSSHLSLFAVMLSHCPMTCVFALVIVQSHATLSHRSTPPHLVVSLDTS